jgi:hypothetical protein
MAYACCIMLLAMPWLELLTAGTPGYVEIEGSTAATKMQQAMAQVGSTPMLALLMAYQPIEVSLSEAVEAAGEGQQQQQQAGPGAITARPVLRLPFDAAAVVNSEEICWICLDSSKPVRGLAPDPTANAKTAKKPCGCAVWMHRLAAHLIACNSFLTRRWRWTCALQHCVTLTSVGHQCEYSARSGGDFLV